MSILNTALGLDNRPRQLAFLGIALHRVRQAPCSLEPLGNGLPTRAVRRRLIPLKCLCSLSTIVVANDLVVLLVFRVLVSFGMSTCSILDPILWHRNRYASPRLARLNRRLRVPPCLG